MSTEEQRRPPLRSVSSLERDAERWDYVQRHVKGATQLGAPINQVWTWSSPHFWLSFPDAVDKAIEDEKRDRRRT